MNKSVIDEKKLQLFDEEDAYQELLMILQQAIITQSFDSIEPQLSAWRRKYPLEKFSDVYKRKIKALKAYFEQEYQLYLNLTEKKKVDTVKAYFELCKIVGNAKWDRNLKLAKAKIKTWENRYYTSDKQKDFSNSYKEKIKHLTDQNYLFSITEKFDQKAATDELKNLVEEAKTKQNFNEFEKNYEAWSKKYPYADFKSDNKSIIDKLMKYEYSPAFEEYQKQVEEINNMGLDLSTEELFKTGEPINIDNLQKSAYFELLKLLNNPDNTVQVLDWIYKYRMLKFDDYHRGLIVEKTAPYYKIPKNKDIQISTIGTDSDLSYDEYSNISKSRKLAATQYFAILYSGRNLEDEDRERFENVYQKSKKALLIQETYEEADNFIEKEPDPIDKELFNPIEKNINELETDEVIEKVKEKDDQFNN